MTQVLLVFAFGLVVVSVLYPLWRHVLAHAYEEDAAHEHAEFVDPYGGDTERGDGQGGTYDLEDTR